MAGQYDDAIIAYLADPATLTRRTTADIALHVMPRTGGGDAEWSRQLSRVRRALRSMERAGMVASSMGTGKLAGQVIWRLTPAIEDMEEGVE